MRYYTGKNSVSNSLCVSPGSIALTVGVISAVGVSAAVSVMAVSARDYDADILGLNKDQGQADQLDDQH